MFEIKDLFCAHTGCIAYKKYAPCCTSMSPLLYNHIENLEKACTCRVHRSQNLIFILIQWQIKVSIGADTKLPSDWSAVSWFSGVCDLNVGRRPLVVTLVFLELFFVYSGKTMI